MGVAGENACFGLAHHLLDTRHHAVQLAPQRLEHDLPPDIGRLLDAVADLLGETLGLSLHPAGCAQ